MKNAPLRHGAEYLAYLGVQGLLRALPHRGARGAGEVLGSLTWRLLGKRRRIVLKNLEIAFPELSDAERFELGRRSCRATVMSFCDAISSSRFDRVSYCQRLTLEGWEHLEAAEADERGYFVMSAHFGCWEAAAHPVGLYLGPLAVVGRPLDNPRLDRYLVEQRTRFGNSVIPKSGAVRPILSTLKKGGRVGLLIDQRAKPGDGVMVPFFGREARTNAILARLSLTTGAPVVPIYGYPEPKGRYRVVARPAIEASEVVGEGASAKDEGTIARLTARYMEEVEAEIRRQPELWMWLHDRWRL
ncbi:MAG: lysophospholipid acyltransferase family protein [Acidobacteriota bacterium]